ncbi:Omega-hydroxypalmitate O-feruloyl transferase [Platanthera zijinensis]|uniref:Omega-hydroxypalmitate O-feruloyl transferase n=1 Tax=Platanthera zijinensis TaxID=2320716 RepID=A0AAP0FY61_9ASPA
MADGKSNANEQNLFKMNVRRSPPIIVHPAGDIKAGGTYFLSNLDQNLPVIMKTIYCFPATDRRAVDKVVGEILRTSLEKVLVHFYPFDGRLAVNDEKKLVVRLNGGGVPFVEATADCELELLGDVSIPQPEKLGMLVYCPQRESIFEMPLLMVQVTKFKCGGFIVGMAMSHSLADGLSTVEFLHAWAETARGLPISLSPFLDRSILTARCPPKPQFPNPAFADLSGSLSSVAASPFPSLPILHRSFSFDPAKLSRLKLLATDAGDDRPLPSTFAALAGLVWRSRTIALNTPSADPAKLLFAVDGRKKLKPPLPGGFFGNGINFACCLCPAGEIIDRPLAHTVRMVQSAIWEVSDESIRSTIDYYEVTRAMPSLAGTLVLTDWTRLGFGATDFGWGCAAQTGPAELPGMEVALFLPPAKGAKTGTTVVLGLSPPAMSTFQEIMDF